jgi:hypothetical protein
MARQISRDPFARVTLFRETVPANPSGGCAWCSGLRFRNAIKGPAYLFRYYTEPDGSARRSYLAGGRSFCSIECARAYNN